MKELEYRIQKGHTEFYYSDLSTFLPRKDSIDYLSLYSFFLF